MNDRYARVCFAISAFANSTERFSFFPYSKSDNESILFYSVFIYILEQTHEKSIHTNITNTYNIYDTIPISSRKKYIKKGFQLVTTSLCTIAKYQGYFFTKR